MTLCLSREHDALVFLVTVSFIQLFTLHHRPYYILYTGSHHRSTYVTDSSSQAHIHVQLATPIATSYSISDRPIRPVSHSPQYSQWHRTVNAIRNSWYCLTYFSTDS